MEKGPQNKITLKGKKILRISSTQPCHLTNLKEKDHNCNLEWEEYEN